MAEGIVDRFRSMPIVSSAAFTGHVVASLARNTFATVLVVAVAVIETPRGLLLGTPVGSYGWQAVAWCGTLLLAAYAMAGALFRRATH